jgi:hypothetical protein
LVLFREVITPDAPAGYTVADADMMCKNKMKGGELKSSFFLKSLKKYKIGSFFTNGLPTLQSRVMTYSEKLVSDPKAINCPIDEE